MTPLPARFPDVFRLHLAPALALLLVASAAAPQKGRAQGTWDPYSETFEQARQRQTAQPQTSPYTATRPKRQQTRTVPPSNRFYQPRLAGAPDVSFRAAPRPGIPSSSTPPSGSTPTGGPPTSAPGGGADNNLFGLGTTAAVLAQTAMQTGKFASQITSMTNRYTKLREQLTTARNALEKLSTLNLRDMDAFISGVDATLASGDNLANSLTGSASDVTDALENSFPAFDESLLLNQDPADVLQQRMTGVHNTLQMLRRHTRQVDQAQNVLADVSSQLSSATSPEQVREAAATLQQFEVQNGQLIRQLLIRQAARRARKRAGAVTNRQKLSASLDRYFEKALGSAASSN